ncbi:MAG: histidine phosphatase family protein [Propionibacteriaceae bacterium]|nr:histidine phosphatase family protein [Propionibacteriaceae bacterium]
MESLGPDEYLAACAARAARTDAHLGIRLGGPITATTSGKAGSPVEWWRAQTTTPEIVTPGDSIDHVAWVPAEEAIARTAGTGQDLVIREGVALSNTVPILIVRHGRAMARSNWSGRDQARPLTARGRRQASALKPLLLAYGVTRLASSTSARCVKTLVPYGTAEQLEIEGWATFSEEQAELSLKAVDNLMRRLIDQTLDSGMPMAICGHRPVLPAMLAALGIPAMSLKPGACVVAHLDPSRQTIAVEHQPPKL